MSKFRRGQQVAPGVVVLKKTGEGGMRKLRCPKCQGVAVERRQPDGRVVNTCGTCGTTFASQAL